MGTVGEMVAQGREFVSEKAKRLMFFEHASGLGFEETVAAVTEAAEGQGWHVLRVNDLQRTYQEAGHPDMTRVQTVELCNPDGAVRILSEDGNKRLAAKAEPEERIGVLLFNPGGPGVSGTEFITSDAFAFFFSPELARHFDVVSWDPRGVSDGTTVDCVDDPERMFALDPTPESSSERAAIEDEIRDPGILSAPPMYGYSARITLA